MRSFLNSPVDRYPGYLNDDLTEEGTPGWIEKMIEKVRWCYCRESAHKINEKKRILKD